MGQGVAHDRDDAGGVERCKTAGAEQGGQVRTVSGVSHTAIQRQSQSLFGGMRRQERHEADVVGVQRHPERVVPGGFVGVGQQHLDEGFEAALCGFDADFVKIDGGQGRHVLRGGTQEGLVVGPRGVQQPVEHRDAEVARECGFVKDVGRGHRARPGTGRNTEAHSRLQGPATGRDAAQARSASSRAAAMGRKSVRIIRLRSTATACRGGWRCAPWTPPPGSDARGACVPDRPRGRPAPHTPGPTPDAGEGRTRWRRRGTSRGDAACRGHPG